MGYIVMAELVLLEMTGIGVVTLKLAENEIRPGSNERRWTISLIQKDKVIAVTQIDSLNPSNILTILESKLGKIKSSEKKPVINQMRNFFNESEKRRRNKPQ